MSGGLFVLAALAVGLSLTACAGPSAGLTGNDTGGIIPWSPVSRAYFLEMASAHCAAHNKIAHITGIDAQYGGYVSFNCYWRRNPY